VSSPGAFGLASSEISQSAIDCFRDIQAARVVLNVAEVLRFHRDKIGDLGAAPSPLVMVEAFLGKTEISDDRLMADLRALLEAEPNFAEAWLELGYVHFDRGNYGAAECCFDQSLAVPPSIAVAEGRVNCAVLAALAKAEAIEAQYRLPEAAAAYAKAIALHNTTTMARITYGRLLRRLGRVREALIEFDAGMDTDFTAMGFETLPRTFRVLADRLMARFAQSVEAKTDGIRVSTYPAAQPRAISTSSAAR
jgi:tetratricopeptide (TPR) repeat protein